VIATCGTQGAGVPTGIGLFGAYPGGTCAYEVVTGASWKEALERGEVVGSMEPHAGEYRLADAKATVPMGPDVINSITQNAGGYGDPLERDPERVAAQVADGTCAPEIARDIYGVVPGDDEAKAARREELRKARLQDLENAREDYKVKPDLEVVRRWGDVLNIARDSDKLVVQCAESGVVLGPLGDNWRDVAPFRRPQASELGPQLLLEERLEFRHYVDPTTGRSLWLDFQKPDEPVTVDFRLTGL
jgi:N-methylhydantoinase B